MTALLVLVPLDEGDGTGIRLPRPNKPVHGADDHNSNEHDHTPVKVQDIRGRDLGPETPEKGECRVEEGEAVDGHTPLSERPAALGQEFGKVDATVENAANGRHVGDHERDQVERNNGVEGGVGADVDEREKDGEDAGDGDGVYGHLELGVYGCDPLAEREAVVAGKGPRLPRGREVVRKSAGVDEDDDNGREDVEGGRAEGLRERVHVWVTGAVRCVVQGAGDVDDAEDVGHEENEAEGAIERVRVEHGSGHGLACVLDLLGHVSCGV